MPKGSHKCHSVQNAAPGFLRRLGCSEHFFHLYAHVYPVLPARH
jgi:hypothetical protein